MVKKIKIAFNLLLSLVFTVAASYAIFLNSSTELYADSTEKIIEEEEEEFGDYIGISTIDSEFAGSSGGDKTSHTSSSQISSTLFLERSISENFKIQKTTKSKGNVIPFYIRFCTLIVYS